VLFDGSYPSVLRKVPFLFGIEGQKNSAFDLRRVSEDGLVTFFFNVGESGSLARTQILPEDRLKKEYGYSAAKGHRVFCSDLRSFPDNTFESAAWSFSVEGTRELKQRESYSGLPNLKPRGDI
jgi:hypothetical protein